jgi:hypothetical protein
MQGIGEVHTSTHPLNRVRYRTRVLSYEIGQRDQSNKGISDGVRAETVEPAQNPLGFEDDRFRKQNAFAFEDCTGTCGLRPFVAGQQPNQDVSIDRDHGGPLPRP